MAAAAAAVDRDNTREKVNTRSNDEANENSSPSRILFLSHQLVSANSLLKRLSSESFRRLAVVNGQNGTAGRVAKNSNVNESVRTFAEATRRRNLIAIAFCNTVSTSVSDLHFMSLGFKLRESYISREFGIEANGIGC